MKSQNKNKTTIDPSDVAAYLIELSINIGEPLTNMKLQKLLYYVYAWYGVEKSKELFDEKIMAWKYGPVTISVYNKYSKYGADVIKKVENGGSEKLDPFTKDLIEEVFTIYGNKTAIELMNLTHSEAPWRDTFNPTYQDTPIPYEFIVGFYKEKKEITEKENGK